MVKGQSSSEMERALAGEQRGAYVSRMFDRIAGRYDVMNRVMSLGQDQAWRRRMAALAQLPAGGHALDLATGTGDVGLALLERQPSATVVGADFSVGMMQVGQHKVERTLPLHFVAADGLALPFADETFDVLLHAFLMRNIADIAQGFAEQWRVLKPGGRVVCLEIVGPEAAWVRRAYHLFFETLVPRLGEWVSGDADAYRYLPASVLRFPPPATLSELMRQAGFVQVRYERVMFGSIAIHVGVKG